MCKLNQLNGYALKCKAEVMHCSTCKRSLAENEQKTLNTQHKNAECMIKCIFCVHALSFNQILQMRFYALRCYFCTLHFILFKGRLYVIVDLEAEVGTFFSYVRHI